MDEALSNIQFMFKDRITVQDAKQKRQAPPKSLTQRLQELFSNSNLTDITFIVGEERMEFTAHKIVLATISPVFRSMLFGDLRNCKDVITITDLTEIGFRNILRFAYDESLHFDSIHECLETLIAANKYLIEALMDICVTFLRQRIGRDNVIPIFDCAVFLDLQSLVQPCQAILDLHIDHLISSQALRFISRRLWVAILSRAHLPCREIDLFRELRQWAIFTVADDIGLEAAVVDIAAQKEVVGDLVRLVRFRNMSVAQLVEVVRPSGLLPTDDLLVAILESSRNEQPNHVLKHLNEEQQTDLVLFYHTGHVSRQSPSGALYGCLDFRVNAKLLLRGFQLFGPKKVIPLNSKGYLEPAKLACTIFCSSSREWAMRMMDKEALLKPCSPLMNTYNYIFPENNAALIFPNEWYRISLSLESPSHSTPISMCSEPVTRCTDINVTFIFRKPGSWKKASPGDQVPYCKFLAGLHYQILSQS